MAKEYIEREAVLNLIRSIYVEELIADWRERDFDSVTVISKKKLFEMPAADVKPVVRGEWQYDTTTDMFACSLCGGIMVRNVYNYCPWCGAQMRRSEDAENIQTQV